MPLRAALHGIAGSQGLQGLQGGTDQQQQGSAKRHARGDSGAAAATAVAPATEKEKNLRVLYQIRTPKVPEKCSARGEEEVSSGAVTTRGEGETVGDFIGMFI